MNKHCDHLLANMFHRLCSGAIWGHYLLGGGVSELIPQLDSVTTDGNMPEIWPLTACILPYDFKNKVHLKLIHEMHFKRNKSAIFSYFLRFFTHWNTFSLLVPPPPGSSPHPQLLLCHHLVLWFFLHCSIMWCPTSH